ncbi:MAG: hypothetical protein NDI61_02870 [Bdellovibrionaceae bacterium]|nr:hypothetical protein [Pseudobdellovibrionaceae bacterium]
MKKTRQTVRLSLRLFGALLMTTSLIACNQGGGADSQAVQALAVDSDLNFAMNKISLDEATFQDVAAHVETCRNGIFCVTICHRPPGDPANSKTMSLPLTAIPAHLNHGSDHHEDKDHVGACDAGGTDGSDSAAGDDAGAVGGDTGTVGGDTGTVGGDTGTVGGDTGTVGGDTGTVGGDTGSVDGGMTDGATDGTTDGGSVVDGGATDSGTVADVPLWCQPNYEIDRNCDGFTDDTNYPLF